MCNSCSCVLLGFVCPVAFFLVVFFVPNWMCLWTEPAWKGQNLCWALSCSLMTVFVVTSLNPPPPGSLLCCLADLTPALPPTSCLLCVGWSVLSVCAAQVGFWGAGEWGGWLLGQGQILEQVHRGSAPRQHPTLLQHSGALRPPVCPPVRMAEPASPPAFPPCLWYRLALLTLNAVKRVLTHKQVIFNARNLEMSSVAEPADLSLKYCLGDPNSSLWPFLLSVSHSLCQWSSLVSIQMCVCADES